MIVKSRSLHRARGMALAFVFKTGLTAQGLRFVLAGGAVFLVHLSATTAFAVVLGLPFQVALLAGYGVAIVVHFSMQRFFVWTHREGFALSLHRQLGWYLLVSAAQYGVTAISTLLLPPVLGISAEAVFLIVVPAQAVINFILYRNGIFHPPSSHADAGELCVAGEK